MATPTLPTQARPAALPPGGPAPSPLQGAPVGGLSATTRTLWSPSLGQTQPQQPQPREPGAASPMQANEASGAVPRVEAPVQREEPAQATAGTTPDAEEGDGRSPLTVRSFASTIQSRRTTPLPPAPQPTSPPAATVPPAAAAAGLGTAAAVSLPAPDVEAPVRKEGARGEETREEVAREEAAPAVSLDGASDTTPPAPERASDEDAGDEAPARPAERSLTLEEEMERLLHDFTLDVSDRR